MGWSVRMIQLDDLWKTNGRIVMKFLLALGLSTNSSLRYPTNLTVLTKYSVEISNYLPFVLYIKESLKVKKPLRCSDTFICVLFSV